MSHDGTKKGYAAYKVTNNVKNHYAVGLGVYDVFINTNGASIYLDNAIEVPNTENVLIENACIVEIANGSGPKVGINHIINDTTVGIRTGADNNGGYAIQRLLSYNNEKSLSLPDYYTEKDNVEVRNEVGETPTNDVFAEKDIVKDTPTKDEEKPLWEMTEEDFSNRIQQGIIDVPTNPEEPTTEPGGTTTPETPTTTPEETTKPQGTETSTELKAGQKFTVGKYRYKVTKVSGKTGKVSLVGVVSKHRKNLKKATIKATVKYKGYSLKVTVIGKKAFNKCKKLEKVTIGKNVTTINAKVFASSKKLKTVVIKGKNLKKVAKNAFNKKVRKFLKIKAKNKPKKVLLKSLNRKN